MSAQRDALLAHLQTGVTTTCRAWGLTRADGLRLGFTDHDRDLAFDEWSFRAESGLTASALMQTTGLSVDNSEALGALAADVVTEADIVAGRYDNASITCWLVNWNDVSERLVLFTGSVGEITRSGGVFRAELRGLSEEMNQPRERVYQRSCTALLGDGACGIDLDDPRYAFEAVVDEVEGGRTFRFAGLGSVAPEWFTRGRLRVLDGAAAGLVGQIKADRLIDASREIDLWQEVRAPIAVGDRVLLQAGCDKRMETCIDKFGNVLNFRGFPDIPGDDWVTSYPQRSGSNEGASLRNDGGEV